VRKPTQRLIWPQSHALQGIFDLAARLLLGASQSESLERNFQHVVDAVERIEGFVWILKDRLDLTPELPPLGRRHRRHVLASVQDLAGGRLEKSHH